jgi:hypothetical protein
MVVTFKVKVNMSCIESERFNESVWEELQVLFPHTHETFSFTVQVKDKLYDLLINEYAEECYYNGVSNTIIRLIKGL